jgi:hypothetical protein
MSSHVRIQLRTTVVWLAAGFLLHIYLKFKTLETLLNRAEYTVTRERGMPKNLA